MTFYSKHRLLKKLAVFLAINMFVESLWPLAAYALTSGPASPEFSSFEPVATTNMVNEFTGDLTYNLPILQIPGAHGGEYALSLSYHSGASPEEEASWVGFGWTLNPGAINRALRGFPDDHNGADVTYYNKMPKNWTATFGPVATTEIFSNSGIAGSISTSLRYNNYKGYGYVAGLGLHVKGLLSLGYQVADGEGSFSYSINPQALLSQFSDGVANAMDTRILDVLGMKNDGNIRLEDKSVGQVAGSVLGGLGSNYGLVSHAFSPRATNITSYTGESWNVSLSAAFDPAQVPIGGELGVRGSYTWQENTAEETVQTYGYLYNKAGADDTEGMMDFYKEKDQPFVQQDKFLGIPFSNPDYFQVSGEGIGGSFRLHHRQAGHYYPRTISSGMDINNLGIEVQVGSDVGPGVSLGVGYQESAIGNWQEIGSTHKYVFNDNTGDEPYFFRFTDDLGGSVAYAAMPGARHPDWAQQALLHKKNKKCYEPEMHSPMLLAGNTERFGRTGRSSYIGWHTNQEIEDIRTNVLSEDVHYKAYSRDAAQRQWVKRDGANNPINDQIGEFAIINEDGNRFVYGLPVYSRMEKNVQYSLENGTVNQSFLAYKDIQDPERKIGELRQDPYPATYLLTEITTPDYVDRTLDGPSNDDFGGWTRFTYTQQFGIGNEGFKDAGSGWYRWRMPYTGLLYNRNMLSDPTDDLGALRSGEKEVYYVSTIETKTHIAVFHISDREDAIPAADDVDAAQDDEASGSTSNRLQKLDRIELFAKKDYLNNPATAVPIKTVRFAYSYKAWPGLPNNCDNISSCMSATGNEGGHLTLEKVWFEYEGIYNARISPYQFQYHYYNGTVPSNFDTYYTDLLLDGANQNLYENPAYHPNDLDAWGNYRPDNLENGVTSRKSNMQTGIYQGEHFNEYLDPDQPGMIKRYDPAAWQLKRIMLPSGGEIHVQYEEDSYGYVQDRPAMFLAPIQEGSGETTNAILPSTYKLDLDDMNLTPGEKGILIDKTREMIGRQGNKIWFKFLYELLGKGDTPDLASCGAEYITGYANVENIRLDGNDNVIIELDPDVMGQKYTLPREVCNDLVETSLGGKLGDKSLNCDPTLGNLTDANDAEENVMNLLNFVGHTLIPGNRCQLINPAYSYFKVALPRPKRGGGLRVKRLLMFDKGIEPGDGALYGNEYHYASIDESGALSPSGVAANEPSTIREENALIHFMPRFQQSFFDRLISGKDKKQSEGPIGESILPGPSVGYASVITKNIHTGRTDAGFSVNEFYTARDYPFDEYYPGIGEGHKMTPILNKAYRFTTPAIVFMDNRDLEWLTQGFRFVQTNMHGQVRRLASYQGNLDDLSDYFNPEETILGTEQVFTYYQPGEKVPMIYDFQNYLSNGPVLEYPGKETEMIYEMREVAEEANDIIIESDVTVGMPLALPIFVVAWPSGSFSRNSLATHTTTKLIRYPAIQKSVLTFQDGIYHRQEHMAFSPETGKPLVTRTTDGFDSLKLLVKNAPPVIEHQGAYHTYQFPASGEYNAMSQQAINENLRMEDGQSGLSIQLEFDPNTNQYDLVFGDATGTADPCGALEVFSAGDLVEITVGTDAQLFHVDESEASNRLPLIPAMIHGFDQSLQIEGSARVRVLASGRTNQLNTLAGSLTTYGPQHQVTDVPPSGSNPARLLVQRQLLVNELNAHIQTNINDMLTGHSEFEFNEQRGSIERVDVDLPSSLRFKEDYKSECQNLLTQQINLKDFSLDLFIDPTTQELVVNLNFVRIGQCRINCCIVPGAGELVNNGDFESPYDPFDPIHHPHTSTAYIPCQNGICSQSGSYAIGQTSDVKPLLANGSPDCMSSKGSIPEPGQFLITLASADPGKGVWCQQIPVSPYNFYTFTYHGALLSPGEASAPLVDIFIDQQYQTTDLVAFKSACTFNEYPAECVRFYSGNNTSVNVCLNINNGDSDINQTPHFGLEQPSLKASYCCQSRFPAPGISPLLPGQDPLDAIGQFEVDLSTGEIVYYPPGADCVPYKLPCLSFATEELATQQKLDGVIAASAQTFSDYWPVNETLLDQPLQSSDPYETGIRGNWRTQSTFTWKSTIKEGLDQASSERIYADAGVFDDYTLFNWENPALNDRDQWLRLNTVIEYSPNGEPMEERDILDIYSTARFGHENTVPILVAQNASFSSVLFESFEETSPLSFFAHTGNVSATIPGGSGYLSMDDPIIITDQITAQGLLVSFWIHHPDGEDISTTLRLYLNKNGAWTRLTDHNLSRIAQSGDWALYEGIFNIPSTLIQTSGNLVIQNNSSQILNIDDIRLQPADAQMNTFVYDASNLRLIANFDDQHFALIYQYNAEGQLIRKLKETERGIKTLEETQYYTPDQPR